MADRLMPCSKNISYSCIISIIEEKNFSIRCHYTYLVNVLVAHIQVLAVRTFELAHRILGWVVAVAAHLAAVMDIS